MKRFVIAIIAVGLIGAGGFAFWRTSYSNKQSNTAPSYTATKQQNAAATQNNQAPADPSEGGKYLVIKEWGVRIPLSENAQIQPLTYNITESKKTGVPNYAELVISDGEFASCMNIRIAQLANKDVPANYSPENGPNSPYTKVQTTKLGEFTYHEQRGFSYCDSEASQKTKRAETLMDELSEGIKKIESYQQ